MTTNIIQVFADAREMQAAALGRLDEGDIRDASEKAWCATKRATDALVLALTGELPDRSTETGRSLRLIAKDEPSARSLRARYYERQGTLHGECFYIGLCEPIEDTERLIRDTMEFIRDAEALANLSRRSP